MMKKFDLTVSKALVFSAIMIVAFTIVMVITFWQYNLVPDSLVVAFFSAFSCESGFCMLIQKMKKDKNTTPVRMGDITGFDDAEVVDEADEGNLVIDFDEERIIDDGR